MARKNDIDHSKTFEAGVRAAEQFAAQYKKSHRGAVRDFAKRWSDRQGIRLQQFLALKGLLARLELRDQKYALSCVNRESWVQTGRFLNTIRRSRGILLNDLVRANLTLQRVVRVLHGHPETLFKDVVDVGLEIGVRLDIELAGVNVAKMQRLRENGWLIGSTNDFLKILSPVKAEVVEIEAHLTGGGPLDNCQNCHGKRGGMRGNENVVDGRILCDYCHADTMP